MSWRARKGLLPSSNTSDSSAARSSPRRFTLSDVSRIMAGASDTYSSARIKFGRSEEEGDLVRGRFRRIRAVHHIALYALGKIRANRTLGGFLRVGGSHDVTVLRNRALACEHLDHDGTGSHVAHKIRVERPSLVHGVEGARVALVEPRHARGNDREACRLKTPVDLADEI